MREYIVIDFETSRLLIHENEIIEACAWKILNGKVKDKFHAYLKPSGKVSEGAFEVHGLSDEFLAKNGQDTKGVIGELTVFLGELPLVAHNGVAFDFPLLVKYQNRYGFTPAANPLIDTCLLMRGNPQIFEGNAKLSTLCEHYRIVNKKAHSADGDVEALFLAFDCLRKEKGVLGLTAEVGALVLSDLNDILGEFPEVLIAITEKKDLLICYKGSSKPQTERWIKPLAYVPGPGHSGYVAAFCYTDNIEKSFRLDRMLKLVRLR